MNLSIAFNYRLAGVVLPIQGASVVYTESYSCCLDVWKEDDSWLLQAGRFMAVVDLKRHNSPRP